MNCETNLHITDNVREREKKKNQRLLKQLRFHYYPTGDDKKINHYNTETRRNKRKIAFVSFPSHQVLITILKYNTLRDKIQQVKKYHRQKRQQLKKTTNLAFTFMQDSLHNISVDKDHKKSHYKQIKSTLEKENGKVNNEKMSTPVPLSDLLYNMKIYPLKRKRKKR